MRNQVLKVGRIANTHGLRGEVKIVPWVDDMHVFATIQTLYLDEEKTVPLELTHVRYHNDVIIGSLSGVDSIDAAEKLKGKELYVEREKLGEPPHGRYYICDLIGLEAYDDISGEQLGKVIDVISTGPHNVYVLGRKNQKDLLIPAIPDVIKDLDIDSEKMIVHMIEGLDEL